MDELLEKYICSRIDPEPELLKELRRETYVRFLNPRMSSGHLQGRVLAMLCKMIRPRRVLELGTFTGYSTLCLAEGLPEGSRILSIDRNDELEEHLKTWFSRSELGSKIDLLFGEALDLIPKLTESFDLVYMDIDKRDYKSCYDLLLQHQPSGTFILIDNTLWNGKPMREISCKDTQSLAIADFNDYIAADSRVEKIILPIRDGLTVLLIK
ncbi:MAG: class I SAM-dependent methyltransferase [Bacteroidales bacterium]|nr:class I SAM-dependent methyltransferase [Bacteroidales bacterium]OQC03582.1 MAG: putative O-methyltransferase [Bacteroidetes bacterium ADurb.Bin090]MBP8981570.1 class I SAM-dependent methyltransferase [Bacteroidales bacterium]HNZ80590.1 O-methyltransferase [Bacteroidales bacterium]HOD26426.1 O-methyltransferase [Bacteroidales bacterium]